MKTRSTAIWLTLFLGGLGIHRFYLNRPISGIFYVLFFWTFIPGIIAFFEFLNFALMSNEDFYNKYNHK